jgi:hypothetical protein
MPNIPDGRYNTKPWDQPAEGGIIVAPTSAEPNWNYLGPFSSNQERLTQQALAVATMTRRDIQRSVSAPLPQIRHNPDRFGYGDRTQPDIRDVISLDRAYQEQRSTWFSGADTNLTGSTRNSLEGV